jgi:uncharacterized protein (UPF0332 family)
MNNNRLTLSKYRLSKAQKVLEVAISNLNNGHIEDSLNRSYYSIFHSMRAVLALEEFDSKKHSGIIARFRENYIRTGLFDVSFSNIIGNAFEMRNDSDYEDFYIISKEDAQIQIENAKLKSKIKTVYNKQDRAEYG